MPPDFGAMDRFVRQKEVLVEDVPVACARISEWRVDVRRSTRQIADMELRGAWWLGRQALWVLFAAEATLTFKVEAHLLRT